jgi:hypothetical protein
VGRVQGFPGNLPALPAITYTSMKAFPSLAFLALASALSAQDPAPAPAAGAVAPLPPPSIPPEAHDRRAFGVLPNYRLADGNQPFHPITPRQKMYIAFKDSTDFPVYPTAAFFAAIYQLEDQNPSFGQGLKGYGHRFITAYGDQVIGNFMIEGVLPILFHEDPRYFARGPGHGSAKSRLWYAATRIFVNRTDRGTNSVNLSELAGNVFMAGIANAYYPDSRRLDDNVRRFYVALGTDALGMVAKEFWPDIKRHLSRKPHSAALDH